jgi:nucleotide-binding universal stress UspA family protein
MTDSKLVQRLVVAVDFTPTSENAIAAAIQIAQLVRGTALHIVHVLPIDPWIKTDGIERERQAIEATYTRLRELVLEVGARTTGHRWDQSFHFHVRLGDEVKAIHQLAVDVDADMIVVGTHARRGLEKLLLGSVAARLIADAHLPVLIARPKQLEGFPRTETLAAADPRAERHTLRGDRHDVLAVGPATPRQGGTP